MTRDRVLNQHSVHAMVGVEPGDHLEHVVLGGLAGQVPVR
jgi:hypothetical protein